MAPVHMKLICTKGNQYHHHEFPSHNAALQRGILAWLQHVEFVAMEDTVLRQHLPEGEGGCPGSIIQALPAGGGQVQDVGVCQAPLAAITAAVQA